MELRKYQKEAIENIYKEWSSGNKRTLVIAATGTGKTILFAHIAKRQAELGQRVLILAHRDELLQQASDKIYSATKMQTALEKASNSCIGSNNKIVVGSVQTLSSPTRLKKFKKDYFGTIIVDEAHHCTADSYQRVLKYFSNAFVLGVTATPERSDDKSLSKYFQSVAYQYPMSQGIKDGYLCPIKTQTIPIKMDLRRVKSSCGDFKVGDLDGAIDPFLEKIADKMKKYCKDRKTIVFLPLIKTSKKFCEILTKKGFNAAEVNGTTKNRSEILEKFKNGSYNVLVNAMLLTEGFDCPDVNCCIVLRPTKSISLYTQMVGRAMRIAEGKTDMLLLDFLWLTKKYDLCKPSILVESNIDVAKKIDKVIAEADGEIDLNKAKEIAEERIMQDREKSLRDQLIKSQKEYESKNRWRIAINAKNGVDPLQYGLSIYDADLSNYVPKFQKDKDEPTREQLEKIARSGIDIMHIDSFGYATMLISKLDERHIRGYATPKQIRCLEKFGFIRVGQWSFVDASKVIKNISEHSWKLPKDFDPVEFSKRKILKT